MRRSTSTARRRSRQLLVGSVGLAVAAAGLAVATPASAAAAPKAPTGLAVRLPNTATPVLTWARTAGATSYQLQIDNDGSFGSVEVTDTTKNTRYVPTRNLSRGTQNWRVRAEKGGVFGPWSTATFSVSPVDVPVGTSPTNGSVLPQPDQPPLMRWQTSRGAVYYTVEIDGDADFIGAKTYTTKTTSFAAPEALPAGDYFWRVTATLDGGFNSLPSPTMSFILGSLPSPKLTYPVDDINQSVEDVVFDWQPVAGAVTYDLQVATDSTFNNFAFKGENIYGSRYSPATTLYNDQFWWRVRAVDQAGQPTAWSTARFSFKRNWLDTPSAVWPLGNEQTPDLSVGESDGEKKFYEWTPVQHASRYVIQVSTDQNFSPALTASCFTASTTFAPRSNNFYDCGIVPGQVHYWRVSGIDDPYPGGVPGIWSVPQKVKWADPAPSGSFTGFATVTGLRAAMTGTGAASSALGCATTTCGALSATPVLTWDRQPGIAYYKVVVGVDENFTFSPIPDVERYRTSNHFFSLRSGDEKLALPESEAGEPYFWYVIPCRADDTCGPSPVKRNPPLPGAHSFLKSSPPVKQLTSSDPAGSDITFSWQDYFDTNQGATTYGQAGQQSAKTYLIQVDNEPSFAEPLIDSATVDQATFTSGDRLYPEGRLYWRVQAIDGEGNGLTWSSTAELVKASPPISLLSPVSGAAVAGTAPLQWAPQAFAKAYDVEIYKNGDTAFSGPNRVAAATVANPAYTPTDTLAASNVPYVWRVRRIDSRGNPGPWSAGTFVSLGSAPELLTPGPGANQPTAGAYFEWSDVQGAASYQVALRAGTDNTVINTVGTAYAPSELRTGSYVWQVTALDAAGRTLGVSSARPFWVDADAPRVLKVTPKKLTKKSTLKVRFTEAVKGANKKTVKLMRANSKGKFKIAVKAKVKVAKKGREVLIDPKGKLKRGTYQIVFTNTSIRDGAGNQLVDQTAAVPGL
ncbi:methionine-rich copper-binding protein CopC [Nocardioides sp. BE266]|uniref:Ig-like domain-containing protein n=1 Tax=Nocardioides sp. BE266 TaxID=2817725 RepID=UPI002861DDD0|nr:Ig-like domain-containing protein [Nocardioides sp. BE266]MDR7253777.1 methionine-rich copper-binding protein CopC [Nocardioides sp. BE266]